MIRLQHTDSNHPDFVKLVKLLDAYLAETDGVEHGFYAQFNEIDRIEHVVVAYQRDRPVGCGAIKGFDASTMEVKRMFVLPDKRENGIGKQLLTELEDWARALGCRRCVLETGKRQPEAVAFYQRCGYLRIPNYGPYAHVPNSVCFEKMLE